MSASARDTIEHELFEICGAPEYGVDTETTTDRILAALSAAGFVVVPREPTESALGVLGYLRTQARNGTLHPQVVIQNANKVLGKEDA